MQHFKRGRWSVNLPYLVGSDPLAHPGQIYVRPDILGQLRHVRLAETLHIHTYIHTAKNIVHTCMYTSMAF